MSAAAAGVRHTIIQIGVPWGTVFLCSFLISSVSTPGTADTRAADIPVSGVGLYAYLHAALNQD